MTPLLLAAAEDRQRIVRQLARQHGCRKRLAERSRLSSPHRTKTIFASPLGRRSDGREGSACEWITRRFLPHRAKVFDESSPDASCIAAGQQVGEQRAALAEPLSVHRADLHLRRM